MSQSRFQQTDTPTNTRQREVAKQLPNPAVSGAMTSPVERLRTDLKPSVSSGVIQPSEVLVESSPGWSMIELPRINDPRGNLSFLEGDAHIPFPIRRVFYLYDVPGGAMRAGHANRACHQFLIAISGSFDVVLDDGHRQETFRLNRSYYGLHIPPLTWREIHNFSSGAVCLAIASEPYAEADYYRDYDAFFKAVHGPNAIAPQAVSPGMMFSGDALPQLQVLPEPTQPVVPRFAQRQLGQSLLNRVLQPGENAAVKPVLDQPNATASPEVVSRYARWQQALNPTQQNG